MKKVICLLLCCVLVLSLSSCSAGGKERYSETLLDYFDTVSSVVAYDSSQAEFNAHLEQLKAKVAEYDRLFDIYDGELKTINETAAEKPVKADGAIIRLLEYGKEVYDLSGGQTNICLGAVLRLWHDARESKTPYLPDMNALKEASKHCDINDLIIENDTVYFKDGEMKLDVGAIAKGFAAREICQWAKENLWESAVINIGGNVCCYGRKPDGSKWNIEIENPRENGEGALETLCLTDLSVVTSGDYQRYIELDGKRYCHIINPQTLMPSEYFSAVTVICEDSALADALSTTLFNMPLDNGKELVEYLENVEALWVDKEYNKIYSKGFEKYIRK